MKVAWLIQNLVPYHHARFDAFSKLAEVEGHLIQVTERDSFEILEFQTEHRSYKLHTLFKGRERDSLSFIELQCALSKTLSAIKPDCVCASGWGLEIGWTMQGWGLDHKIPVVMFSESTEYDEVRRWHKEWIKSILVKACQASLVGGTPHKEYITQLGMPGIRVSLGHNVVNSKHFEVIVPQRPDSLPESFGDEPYFLCCTRFGKKKNLPSLVRAYGRYLQKVDGRGLKLVLAGDGELRKEIERTIKDEDLCGNIVMLGAVAYADLPWLYQNCVAFIHASTTEQWGLVVNEAMAAGVPILISERCGCARDLVKEEDNGFHFDPFDEGDMANVLTRFSQLSDEEKRGMGLASKRIIAEWGPDRFASGLKDAIGYALQAGKPSRYRLARCFLHYLPNRGVF